eukprot:CAMPEP_0201281350 /NCGR_PEP_ID=MMETSP1317-20130820/2474_1 /ASSEMBLY_ACC=CAM_ASM_000770 /TAXON_ID=187299 /ORGANISM="Undescribed Undescribed, Strain Undescribed" /LENGTH=102 /DNA_ID=CAMNT_0047590961 /DNA_START=235 /DNA_END=543 /DNA_ORIENTATION=+
MIDEDGYLKLIDFGTAKIIRGRTYTQVGTPHYMAPEIIMGLGYGFAVDWWALGCILYEFLCLDVPFGADFEDPQDVYNAVLNSRLKYPGFLPAVFPAKSFIE